jgi:hypothetical protein
MKTMRDIFEGISKRLGPDEFEFQGKKGRWRTVKGSEIFFPEDGSGPMGMPNGMKKSKNDDEGPDLSFKGKPVPIDKSHWKNTSDEQIGRLVSQVMFLEYDAYRKKNPKKFKSEKAEIADKIEFFKYGIDDKVRSEMAHGAKWAGIKW